MKVLQVGMLIPWVNTAMEEEIPNLVYSNIGLHWSRLRPNILPMNGHDTSYLESMLSSIPDALSKFDGLDLHAIVLGCTSACLIDSCSDLEISAPYKRIKFITALDAILNQIEKIKAHRLILFAPYDTHTIQAEVELLQSHGVDVIKSVSLAYEDEIRFITSTQIYEVFVKEYTPDYDAILFSCTALYTLKAIDIIKRNLLIETPLLSSNIAISSTLNDLYCQHYSHMVKRE
ncbi:MAG: hypothetical protein ABIC57_03430 [bacterium]